MKEKLNYITNLRFPLIFGVVMDHASLVMPQSVRGDDIPSIIFSLLLTLVKISVPVFFIMSGFLFFKGVESFNAVNYRNKLRSRWRTLLVPYVLWTFIYFLYIAATHIPQAISTNNPEALQELCTWRIFWMYREGLPLHFSLWYIRDLILMCICSPVIWFVLKQLRHLGLFIIFGLFVFYRVDSTISFPMSIFYFSLGVYLSVCSVDVRCIATKIKWGVFAIIVVALICSLSNCTPLKHMSQATLALGILLMSCFITEKFQCKVPRLLTDSVFFVYATHCIMFVMMFNKVMMKIIPDSAFPAMLFLRWGFVGILTTATCIILYITLKKLFPKTIAVLIGSR